MLAAISVILRISMLLAISMSVFISDDIKFTKRFAEAGKIFGIEILDHIIIGNGVFSSLKEMNKF